MPWSLSGSVWISVHYWDDSVKVSKIGFLPIQLKYFPLQIRRHRNRWKTASTYRLYHNIMCIFLSKMRSWKSKLRSEVNYIYACTSIQYNALFFKSSTLCCNAALQTGPRPLDRVDHASIRHVGPVLFNGWPQRRDVWVTLSTAFFWMILGIATSGLVQLVEGVHRVPMDLKPPRSLCLALPSVPQLLFSPSSAFLQ